jgi:hypothetical protein
LGTFRTWREVGLESGIRRAPANGWSYYGLAELHKSRGDAAAARKAEADLARTWIRQHN